ncbi:oxygen-dependent coproporphyrinogen oxidase [Anaplasma capra]|uniref:oxygen-dependent coproporphyrinogen oxidase n=1 Tax=Anaplasma capra TaxID=1562740 RepID=UPI0021D5D96C|nr:oxygen-dependent coproporphyrinogen oxidase [Anaplasma capra]MCU7611576.1 oxygen-dependent coproporphyrinogen oxidase [Anaplasma capra]MCU7611985.1 oxygen-dependent coproporphyrinogen oxidase [Anaplasma capra]
MDAKKKRAARWFSELQDRIAGEFLAIENEFSDDIPEVKRKKWDREGGGGGESVVITGRVFEKAGVNFSVVHGVMDDNFAGEVPGAKENGGNFWASGISVVAHMQSPFVPAVHMNTRFMCTSQSWFGGGMDLTPTYYDEEDEAVFHDGVRAACDKFNSGYYSEFKRRCDEYFYLPHRKEARGVGGIFYDNLCTGDWEKDFEFTREVGECFLRVYPHIVRKNMRREWGEEERNLQLLKRGRYVEFNLIYDRGTRFGIMTGGNPDAIMMSMPPLVRWE